MSLLLFTVTFLASIRMLCVLLIHNQRVNSLYVWFSLFVCSNSLGMLLTAVSASVEQAIWATKILYIGGIFAPMTLTFVIAHLCDLKFPRLLKFGMEAAGAIVLGLVFTIGYNDIYYINEFELGHKDGISFLVKTNGPTHILYPILVMLYAGILFFYIIYAIRRKKNVSFLTIITITVSGLTSVIMYGVEKIVELEHIGIAIGCLVASVCMAYLFKRINAYDMTTNIATAVDKMKEYGYIEFDKKNRYVNANKYAKELFPEIENDWVMDKRIPTKDTFLYKEIVKWAFENKDLKKIQIGEQFFDLNATDIIYRDKPVGTLIELIDRTEEYKYTATIENYNADLEKEVAEKTAEIIHVQNKMVIGMASMIESRDESTGGHINRTSDVVRIFSKYLLENEDTYHMSKQFLDMVTRAAPMHDLGKIAVDDKVLRKQDKYTDDEYNEMKRHAEEGGKIAEKILRGVETDTFVDIVSNVAHYHHEKWDGTGYPQGLSKEEIPIEARIMALADVFDALVSKRCYKDAYSYDKSFSIIEESLGKHFDPELGKAFIMCRDSLERLYNSNL